MPFIPPEQLARAREMDLLTYLRCCEPDELVSVGGNAYATKSHDSLKISNGEWYWWSRGVGGSSALDYLTTVRKLSLPDAVQRILSAGGVPLAEPPRRKARPTKSFSLPPRHADNRRVFSYLRGRGIDRGRKTKRCGGGGTACRRKENAKCRAGKRRSMSVGFPHAPCERRKAVSGTDL